MGVFPETSPEKCVIFKDILAFFATFCFETDGWDFPKNWKKRSFDIFSSKNIRQLRLKRSTTA